MNKNNLLSVSEYARAKDVSRQYVINWIKQGKVKAQKVGKTYIVILE